MEHEITQIRAQIRETVETEARERAAADALVASMREANADLLKPENFEKIDEAYKRADVARDSVATLRTQQERLLGIVGEKVEERKTVEDRRRGDYAARMRDSAPFQELLRSGQLKSSGHVRMDPIEDILTRDELGNALRQRTTFDNSTNIGSGLLVPDYTGKMVEQLVRKVRFLDVITVGQTDTDTVDWISENSRTDAAVATPYGTAVPESAYGFRHNQTSVRRMGHFVPATKGILMDAGQTKTLLDSRLVNGLERYVEQQTLTGAGTGEQLLGLLNTSGGLTRALSTDTRLDAVHKAITDIRVDSLGQIEPSVICLSPSDYEKLVLEKTATGAYQFGMAGNPDIWGLKPVVSVVFTSGSPIIGDFKEACTLWLREGVSLSMSDSHASFFLQGLVALMVETRAAFATTRVRATNTLTGF